MLPLQKSVDEEKLMTVCPVVHFDCSRLFSFLPASTTIVSVAGTPSAGWE
jgi:hypothetical protein